MGKLLSSDNPVGKMIEIAGTTIPIGYLPCDGAAISRTTYRDLFLAISTTYGTGDGTTTFNVPDSRGRAIIGDGAGVGLTVRTLGTKLGEENHQLTLAELASHNHGGGSHTHSSPGGDVTDGSNNSAVRLGLNPNAGMSTGGPSTTVVVTQGSDNSHNNMQPSLVVKRAIKY